MVVDVTNAPSWEDKAVLEFFETSTRNVFAAEEKRHGPPRSSLPIIPNGSPEKRFSFRVLTLDCTGKRFSNRKGKRKRENEIVRRRACCERGHDWSSEPRKRSRSDRDTSQGRGCTQCAGGSCSDAARRCFIVQPDADAVIRQ